MLKYLIATNLGIRVLRPFNANSDQSALGLL